MATGHSVVVFDDKYFEEGIDKYLEDDDVFALGTLPHGRFPSLSELRECIHELGYELEESGDWYVTSEDDRTEIWFTDDAHEDQPTGFWFRRGYHIVLNLSQKIANCRGSLMVFNHSGYAPLLFVPDAVFPTVPPSQSPDDFFTVISRRLPLMIEQLAEASNDQRLFLLSQIRSALEWADYPRQYEFFQVARQGLPTFKSLLQNADPRIRFLAFDLIITLLERFSEHADTLKLSIQNESDGNTKARMVSSVMRPVARDWVGRSSFPWDETIVELAIELLNDLNEYAPVRFAAANLLIRAWPGLLTLAMREVLIDALKSPERYVLSRWSGDRYSTSFVVHHALESIERLRILNHRVEVLKTALPQITIAEDAHKVLRVLLDNVFLGATRFDGMSYPLPEDHVAERPDIDESKFRDESPGNWLYFANPTKLTVEDLLPFQRSILETVMDLTIPWMVHSNLPERYGLPPTRSAVRALLNIGQ